MNAEAGSAHRLRLLIVLRILGIVVGTAVLAVPGVSAAQTRTELGSETVITGARSGFVPVSLARPVRVAGSRRTLPASWRIKGGGPVAGMLLRAEAPADLDPYDDALPPAVAFWRAHPDLGRNVWGTRSPQEGAYVLPAGDYRLYVITDSTPVEISFTLAELSPRRVDLHPVFGVPAFSEELPLVRESALPRSWALGKTAHASSAGWLTVQVQASGEAVYRQQELCIYDGEPTGSAPYEPGCPGARIRGGGFDTLTTWEVHRGAYGIGGNVEAIDGPSPSPRPSVRAALLSFDPPSPLDPVAPGSPPVQLPPPVADDVDDYPLPRLASRVGTRVKTGVRVRFRCDKEPRCVAYARINRESRRRLSMRPHSRRSLVLPSSRRTNRFTVSISGLHGERQHKTRLRVR